MKLKCVSPPGLTRLRLDALVRNYAFEMDFDKLWRRFPSPRLNMPLLIVFVLFLNMAEFLLGLV